MPYADYEQDLMSYFSEKVVEWKTAELNPITLPVAWFNMILKEDEYDKEKPWLKFSIVESRSYQPSIGRGEGCTYKRVLGQIVVDIFYPFDIPYLELNDIINKVEGALEQQRIVLHTLTGSSYRINRHEYRGMKAKRIYTKFETNLSK